MNEYTIVTNKREVEWIGQTGKEAREQFFSQEIAPKKNADPLYNEKIRSVRLKKKRFQQLTIFDDPTYHD